MLVFSLIGCGRQDRLDPVAMELPVGMETKSWGPLEDMQPVYGWGSDPHSIGAWSADDILLGMYYGRILRKTGPEYRMLNLPEQTSAIGLVCLPEGNAWCLDYSGCVWYLNDSVWTMEVALEESNYSGLMIDGQDRLWAFGSDGKLWRGQSGEWAKIDLPDSLHLDDGWISSSDQVFLVSNGWDVVQVNGQTAQITPLGPPGEGSPRLNKMIEGDNEGRLVVASEGENDFWVFDGQDWIPEQTEVGDFFNPNALTDVFWLEGNLYGVLADGNTIARWDGENWVEEQNIFEHGSHNSPLVSIPLGSGRLLALRNGLIAKYSPGMPEVISPKLGRIVGLGQVEDVLHVGLDFGECMVQEDNHWLLGARVLPDGENMLDGGLLADSEGGLVFISRESIIRQLDGLNTTLMSEGYNRKIFHQSDGTAVVMSSDDIWELVGDKLSRVGTPQRGESSICRGRDGRFWFLNGWQIGRFVGDWVEPRLTVEGWRPRGLINDPERGLVIYGDNKVLVEDGDGFRNVSPWIRDDSAWIWAGIRNMCLDGQGGWVASHNYNETLFHYDGEIWVKLDATFSSWDYISHYGLDVTPARDGSFLIYNDTMVKRLTPERGLQ